MAKSKPQTQVITPEYIPIQYPYDYSYYEYYPLSQVVPFVHTTTDHATSPETVFESALSYDDSEKSVAESEENSIVESLHTQASKCGETKEERRLQQRQKQIDYGKNTIGYKRYLAAVPKNRRKYPDPETPDKNSKCSKRAWDGLVRSWRRKLHQWDPPEPEK